MNKNFMLKLLTSLPIICVFLYYIPFLGVILTLLRKFVHTNKKDSTSIFLIVLSIIILIPKMFSYVLNLFNFNDSIPYLNEIVNSGIYSELLSFSKFILCFGIILLVLSLIFKSLFEKFKNYCMSYIQNKEKVEREVVKENNMKIQEKQEKAKNTHVVYCPNCGADNMIYGNSGTCKYCRQPVTKK